MSCVTENENKENLQTICIKCWINAEQARSGLRMKRSSDGSVHKLRKSSVMMGLPKAEFSFGRLAAQTMDERTGSARVRACVSKCFIYTQLSRGLIGSVCF